MQGLSAGQKNLLLDLYFGISRKNLILFNGNGPDRSIGFLREAQKV
jgi:hypothetical protein